VFFVYTLYVAVYMQRLVRSQLLFAGTAINLVVICLGIESRFSCVTQVAEALPKGSTQSYQEVQQAKPRFQQNNTMVNPHYNQPVC